MSICAGCPFNAVSLLRPQRKICSSLKSKKVIAVERRHSLPLDEKKQECIDSSILLRIIIKILLQAWINCNFMAIMVDENGDHDVHILTDSLKSTKLADWSR